MMTKNAIGVQGENIAAAHLVQAGYRLIARNWHCQQGELDIVAEKNGQLIFVEVKTRRGVVPEDIATSLTAKKRDRLLRAIYAYLDKHNEDTEGWRFDFVTVSLNARQKPVINHMENALDW